MGSNVWWITPNEYIKSNFLFFIYLSIISIFPHINVAVKPNISNLFLQISNETSDNSIEHENEVITKSGLTKFLEGEVYFYKEINKIHEFNSLFPKFFNSYNNGDLTSLYIQNINGIPLYFLYKYEMMTNKHLLNLLEIVNKLHNYNDGKINITNEDIINNYSTKLKERFLILDDYLFEDAKEIQEECLKRLDDYYESKRNSFKICKIIHGDL